MFYLLLSSVYTETRPFLLLILHQQVGWRCTKIWGETQLRRLTLSYERGILCHMTSYSAYEGKAGAEAVAQRLSGYWSVGGEQLFSSVPPVCLKVYFFDILLFITVYIITTFQLFNCLYLNMQVFSLSLFQFSALHPAEGVR